MIPGRDALRRLREGNARFASNVRGPDAIVSHTKRPELPSEQEPMAIIFGCSDARVPAELIFDQGLGDLFVIRVATLEELRRPTENQSRNLQSIVDRIRPSVEDLLATDLRHDTDALIEEAVRRNIRTSANHLRHGSAVLEQLVREEGLLIVGAEYSLETGEVDFFDGVPA